MKRVILSCPTLKRELEALLQDKKADTNIIYLPSELHSSPRNLHAFLQTMIDMQPKDVQQILLCVSGCGGATKGLTATTAELVIPKTMDCIDVLLSGSGISRNAKGIFLTESWMQFFKASVLDYGTMVRKCGKDRAEERLKTIYRGFEHFYIIDTGTYDVATVSDYIRPLVELLDGTLDIISGNYHILRKIVSGCIDEDFQVVPKGSVSL